MASCKKSNLAEITVLQRVFPIAWILIALLPSGGAFAQASFVVGSMSNVKTAYSVGAGNNRLIVASISGKKAVGLGTITSVTWNGQSFTNAVVENGPAVTPTLRTEIWYLNEAGIRLAGYCGVNDIIVTWSVAPTNEAFSVFTVSDVDQTTPVPAGTSTGVGTNAGITTTATLSAINTGGVNDLVVYASASNANRTHTPSAGYTEQSDQVVAAAVTLATATKALVGAGPETPVATWVAGNSQVVIAGVVFNGITAISATPTTYYSFASGAWDSNSSWSLTSDGSSGAAATWPGRADNVVIKTGHNITINAVDDNKTCGISPDGLLRANVGPFAASNLVMFYQTGDISIKGTLTVTGIEMMIENYTHIFPAGTFSLSSSIVNLKFLEADAGSTLSSLDDIILAGNSQTTINSNAISNDDLIISFTNATLCGSGVATLQNGAGSVITYANGATVAQICTSFTVACTGGGCVGFPVNGTTVVILGNAGPGGVGNSTNNKLWLKANDLNQANGTAVTSWPDASGNGLTAAANIPLTPANQPTFNTNFVNTLPSISFDGGDWLTLGNASLNFVPRTNPWSFFGAFNVPTNASGTLIAKADATAANRQYQYTIDGTTPNRFAAFIGGTFTVGGLVATGAWTIGASTVSASATGLNTFVNETADLSNAGVGLGTLPGADVMVGARRVDASTTTAGFNITGNIAEIAMYNVVTPLAQRIIIENYLAAKYNITLASNDLYTMDNAGNGNYDFEVAGVGQASDGTTHKDAKGSGIVRMWNPSTLSNNSFFFWGHDGTALLSSTFTVGLAGVDGTIIQERLNRIYRVSENIDVGTLEISFDVSGLSPSFLGSNLRLLIDRNGNGFGDNDVAPISGSFNSNVVVFSGVNLQSGDRFTLGNTDKTKPLPIGLTDLEAHRQNSVVVLKWTTESELNNDFFTMERSLNGTEWESLGTVKGAGTSNSKKEYTSTDEKPYRSVSYYRLMQTDYNKNSSYSRIVAIPIDQSENEIFIFPNPSHNTFTIIASELVNPDLIRFCNSLGQDIPISIGNIENATVINPGDISPGIYLIKVQTSHGLVAIKVVRN